MREPPSNTGASVRQRLLNLAREQGQPMELLLTRYALERLLLRLSDSRHRERFVLKGAMLLVAWFHEQHRATRGLDLLGFGNASHDVLLQTFREIMALPFDDGVSFDLAALTIAPIREQTEYGGSRLRTTAALAGARIPITIDIGFGDAVDPGTAYVELPALLGMPAPRLRTYPPEAVIAEKLHAIVVLGMANSRMKDYYDVWMLLSLLELDRDRLHRAISATFLRRSTVLPVEIPEGLTDAFADDATKLRQWGAFARDLSAGAPALSRVVLDLRTRLWPILSAGMA